MSNKLGIEYLQQLAFAKKGKCLSKNYIDKNSKYEWKCKNGHTWKSKILSIRNGTWCIECKRIENYQELVKIAKSKSGKLLSKAYYGSSKLHEWECENKHKWKAKATKIKNDNTWCPECKKGTIDEMKILALKKEGELLSKFYEHSQKKLQWKCKNNHTFSATPSSVKSGSWCPECRKIGLPALQEKAKERNGKLLSISYTNQFAKLDWQCHYNHKFRMSAHDVMSKKQHWCPVCKESFGEKFSRLFFSKAFNTEFIKCRPNWLTMNNRSRLELDGYSKTLKMAFEHQGDYHNNLEHPFNASVRNSIMNRDSFKLNSCKKNGVTLILIPQLKPEDGIKKNIEILISILKTYNIDVNSGYVSISSKELFNSRHEKQYQILLNLISKREGKLRENSFVSGVAPIHVTCKNNHEFKTNFGYIKSGRWCPECAPNKKHSLKEIKLFSLKKNIKCLSKSYKNNSESMAWECLNCKNKWNARFGNIRSGKGCPICRRKEGDKKRTTSIESIKELANKNNFTLISKKYKNNKIKLEWMCRNKHPFKRSFSKIKINWSCPECKKNGV